MRKWLSTGIAAILVFAVMFGTAAAAAPSDAKQTWSVPILKKLSVADAVTLIVDRFDLGIDVENPKKASEIFANVEDDAPYADDMVTAYYNGLPLPEDVDPEALVTKEYFAHLLFSAILTKGDYAFIEIFLLIEDEDDIDPEYMNSIQKLLIADIMALDKKGNFHPKNTVRKYEAERAIDKAIRFIETTEPIQPEPDPGRPDPQVTMTTEPVTDEVVRVILSRGEQPHPGYGISIDRIEFRDQTALIYYTLHEPDPDKMYPMVIVEPKAVTYVSSEYTPKAVPTAADEDHSVDPNAAASSAASKSVSE